MLKFQSLVVGAAVAGWLFFSGCNPADCELNPNQPECRDEGDESYEELPEPSNYIEIARSTAYLGAYSVYPTYVHFSGHMFIPADRYQNWNQYPAGPHTYQLTTAPNGYKYIGSGIWFGTLVRKEFDCSPQAALRAICRLKTNPSSIVYVQCPSTADLTRPFAYSNQQSTGFKYDFANRFVFNGGVSATVSSVQVAKLPDGQNLVRCHLSQSGKTMTIVEAG